jgi:glycosyltransferase involved in cell wall biosynthesis
MEVKRILVLSYYFEPDLSAGSFRNTALVKKLSELAGDNVIVEVITTQPNRYKSFKDEALAFEQKGNLTINRIKVPQHASGFKDQIFSYLKYYKEAIKIAKANKYNLVYASSSRLFTCYLGKQIAKKNNCKLYLDVRDIFVENMEELLQNKPILKHLALPIIRQFVEKPSFNAAHHMNLVSEGFKPYFQNFKIKNFSYYTNGIDDVFLNVKQNTSLPSFPKVIVYAGNIGDGQGLEKVIPAMGKNLGNDYLIKIIGDGGTKHKLISELESQQVTNVEVLAPVKRDELISIYQNAHYLFLHLNTLKAFERVLPSKIFEYAALNLPVIAGVGGYAASFISSNVEHSFVTNPCNAIEICNYIINTPYKNLNRENFKNKFSRENITSNLAKSILNYLN